MSPTRSSSLSPRSRKAAHLVDQRPARRLLVDIQLAGDGRHERFDLLGREPGLHLRKVLAMRVRQVRCTRVAEIAAAAWPAKTASSSMSRMVNDGAECLSSTCSTPTVSLSVTSGTAAMDRGTYPVFSATARSQRGSAATSDRASDSPVDRTQPRYPGWVPRTCRPPRHPWGPEATWNSRRSGITLEEGNRGRLGLEEANRGVDDRLEEADSSTSGWKAAGNDTTPRCFPDGQQRGGDD